MRSDDLERRAVPITKVALAAVQYEAHEEPPIHVDRHRHDAIDPDGTVVIIVERRALEFGLGLQVADPLRHRAGIATVLAHERVIEEVPIEYLELARRDRTGLIAHYATVPRVEIAYR